MNVQIAFLRGVGHGPGDMLDMPALREALAEAGFAAVHTYLDSGNVVLLDDGEPGVLAARVGEILQKRFDRDIHVIVRSLDELSEAVARDPFPEAAADAEHYNVAFLETTLDQAEVEQLAVLATGRERVAVIGRELYGWYPDGFAGSRLIGGIMGLPVPATARDWTTVSGVLDLGREVRAENRSR